MDKETAKKILEIMLTADGGCEYAYLARKMYKEEFNQELIIEELAKNHKRSRSCQ